MDQTLQSIQGQTDLPLGDNRAVVSELHTFRTYETMTVYDLYRKPLVFGLIIYIYGLFYVRLSDLAIYLRSDGVSLVASIMTHK